MKVSPNKNSVANSQLEGVKTSKSEAAIKNSKTGLAESKGLGGSANVDVSERAQMMKKAKDIASEQTIDEGKVSRLQRMIDEGKYNVDANLIADRLVDAHLLVPDEA